MTPGNLGSQAKVQGLSCPSCGKKGKAVKPITIESLLTDEARARARSTKGFRFCYEPTCDIAYFHPMTGERFLHHDVRVRISQKETTSPRPVCYCFNHTVEEIEAEVAETGVSRIPNAIMEKCRQGLDRCEETNPQGSCCLGNVQRALKEAQAKYATAAARGPSSETARATVTLAPEGEIGEVIGAITKQGFQGSIEE